MDPHREGSLRQPKVEILDKCHSQELAYLARAGEEDDEKGKTESFHDMGYYAYFQSGTLSDLTIHGPDNREWKVHKIIVGKNCDFFANAVSSGFKESQTNVIEMINDDPGAINALLEYLYVGDYGIPKTHGVGLLTLHVEVYIIAGIYCVPGLQEMAYGRFVRLWMSRGGCCRGLVPFVVQRVYESLPDTDTRMRDFLSCVSAIHLPGLLVLPMFGDLMATFSAYRSDIAKALLKIDTGFRCENCCERAEKAP